MFKTYKTGVDNQLNGKIKIIRSNRGREYKSTIFADFYAQHEIVHQITTPYIPQQNNVAERKNSIFEDMINFMLDSLGLSHNLWGEALLITNYI